MAAEWIRAANRNTTPRDPELAILQHGYGGATPPPAQTALALARPRGLAETTCYHRLRGVRPVQSPTVTPDPRERNPRLGVPSPAQPGPPPGAHAAPPLNRAVRRPDWTGPWPGQMIPTSAGAARARDAEQQTRPAASPITAQNAHRGSGAGLGRFLGAPMANERVAGQPKPVMS